MALNSSGPISLAGTTTGQSIEIELGGNGSTQISLNCTSVRTLAGVPSGAIIMPTNFYGKANVFTYTVSANQTNFCMRAGAVTAGWNGTTALKVIINSGVFISSNTTGTPGMTIGGSYPSGVTVTNSGTIAGMGGNGGTGASGGCGGSNSTAGAGGGTAIKATAAVTICNVSGTIAGGGGGGGGGGSTGNFTASSYGGGGGGGRTGKTNSSGGSPGGGAGTCAAGGTGANGGSCGCYNQLVGGKGGNGGTWGSTGGTGTQGASACFNHPPSAGGAGGKATCGAATYITWTNTGTRYGSIS